MRNFIFCLLGAGYVLLFFWLGRDLGFRFEHENILSHLPVYIAFGAALVMTTIISWLVVKVAERYKYPTRAVIIFVILDVLLYPAIAGVSVGLAACSVTWSHNEPYLPHFPGLKDFFLLLLVFQILAECYLMLLCRKLGRDRSEVF